ncbi:putative MFS transporter [Meredithblackwellia eburnea MCA 4105]
MSTFKQEESHMERGTMKETQETYENASFPSPPAVSKEGDVALAASQQHIIVTDEDSRRICRRTDLYILSLLVWVYFLQILDKSIIGYSAVFGLKTDTHLVGNQYSDVGAIGYYAQLGAQPVGAFLLVKLKPRMLLPILTFCWGASLLGMCGSTNFAGLMASRFLLGLFEALCLPLFSLLTVAFYRRSEQPLRVAAWYSTNGLATSIGSALSYGLAQIKSDKLHSYQIIFLMTGLLTVLTAPIIWLRLDNSVVSARYLNAEDRVKAVERLRANQTGIATSKFKIEQIKEFFLDAKSWLFFCQSLAVNVGASVITVMGPILLQGIAGFSSETSVLLNIPFGVLQFILIWLSSYVAWKSSKKSYILAGFIAPVVVGCAILYAVPRTVQNKGALLFGYYLLAFLFAANPLIISWISGNTAGQTKKSAMITLYNAGSATGNIVGPYLYKASDSPAYLPGIRATMGFFCACEALIGLTVLWLFYLNKRHERTRVAKGKPAKLEDTSMHHRYQSGAQNEGEVAGDQAFLDKTDLENEMFKFIY